MPGTGACEWQGIHPLEDLIQVENPPGGYLQNCNVAPQWLFVGCSLTPDKYWDRPYVYNAQPGPPHQRAAMVLNLLDGAKQVDVKRAIGLALSTQVYRAEAWQDRIRKAAPPQSPFVSLILDWNRHADADSRGALAFYLFKAALGTDGKAVEPAASPGDDQIRDALRKAEDRLRSEFPADAVFGTLFRVGREGSARTFPVGGGTLVNAGMAMLRAVTYEKHGKEMVGDRGQTATQVVILTRPPRSFMVIPLGESDHANSGHFEDQAEKLFSPSQMKSTYFLDRKELNKHVQRTERLRYPGAHETKVMDH
jgi:hypothetical protein